MKLIEYPDREIMAMQVADTLAGALKKCLLVHEFASFAVPGGTTPGPIFDMLCATKLEWERVHVMLTDERWVPEDDDRSNTKLLHERLLQENAAAAKFIPFFHTGQSAAEGAATTSETLVGELPLSLLVLGMGDDMHTASLFPGAEGLEAAFDAQAPAVCPIQPKGQDIARVTLSAPVLQGAMDTHLVITGAAKRDALDRAMGLPPQVAPIAAVLGGGTVHWAA